MDLMSYLYIGLIIVQFIYFIVIYNNLVRLKHNVAAAWSNIDVLLKQRFDELPKLVQTCNRYMKHEQETLERVMMARAGVQSAADNEDIKAVGSAETQMRSGLSRLFALSEDYPELKANEQFQHLQARITGLENSISDRREFYNDSVNINNTRIEQFPDLMIARLFKFNEKALLRFSDATPVNLKDHLNNA